VLIGYGDPSSFINIQPTVADKSWETAFYFQDDYKLSAKLTVNLGLRYEWSTPYTERFNHQQYSDFSGDYGSRDHPLAWSGAHGTQRHHSVSRAGRARTPSPDRLEKCCAAPGFCVCVQFKNSSSRRCGNLLWLEPGDEFSIHRTAFSSSGNIFFTQDGFNTQYATFSNPFPNGLPQPEGTTYGQNPNWGFSNSNNLGTEEARNANIYQWNIGIQRLLPRRLPWASTTPRTAAIICRGVGTISLLRGIGIFFLRICAPNFLRSNMLSIPIVTSTAA